MWVTCLRHWVGGHGGQRVEVHGGKADVDVKQVDRLVQHRPQRVWRRLPGRQTRRARGPGEVPHVSCTSHKHGAGSAAYSNQQLDKNACRLCRPGSDMTQILGRHAAAGMSTCVECPHGEAGGGRQVAGVGARPQAPHHRRKRLERVQRSAARLRGCGSTAVPSAAVRVPAQFVMKLGTWCAYDAATRLMPGGESWSHSRDSTRSRAEVMSPSSSTS